MNADAVTSKLIEWIRRVTCCPNVIKGYQSEYRPDLPYIMVHLQAMDGLHDNITRIESSVTTRQNRAGLDIVEVTHYEEMAYTFAINAYGEGGEDMLLKIRSCYQADRTPQELDCLTIHDVSALRLLPEIVKNSYEKRANCAIILHKYHGHTFETDTIEEYTFNIEQA